MAGVLNRTNDASQQKQVYEFKAGLTGTGVSAIVAHIAYPCVAQAGQIAAFGLSGAPSYQLVVNRFVVGAGATSWAITGANIPPAYGTSGVLATGMSMLASGQTLLNLMPNDVVMVQTAVANTAATCLAVNLVVQAIQDQKKFFGTLA